MTIQEHDSPTDELKYKFKYSSIHLKWLQFFINRFNVSPRLIFFYKDRTIVIIDSKNFPSLKLKWARYCKNNIVNNGQHIRIINNSNNLEDLIKNWFPNIKSKQVSIEKGIDTEKKIEFQDVTIQVAKNLRQFIIGRAGFELEMLDNFLNTHFLHNNNYFRCRVI
jgi:hypothetical protein